MTLVVILETKEFINKYSMKKFSQITESVWSDIRKRGLGDEVKAEDDINNLGRDELYNLIFDLYEQVDEHLTPLKGQVTQSRTYFHIPIFKNERVYPLDVVFVDNKISEIKLMTYKPCIENFKHPLSDKFSITIRPDKALDIKSKDGEVSNQVCMDLIKTIVEDAPEPYLKKREN